MNDNFLHSDITKLIIKAFYKVYNKLGYGFLEKVYERALIIGLRKLGLYCNAQVSVKVFYDGFEVGVYIADIIVNECVIIEIKAVETLFEEHVLQLVNYLKASNIEVGILLNFGKKPQFHRKVFSSTYKNLNKS